MKKAIAVTATMIGIACFGGVAVFGLRAPAAQPSNLHPDFAEMKWPFLVDQWGVGKAFVCQPANCGARIEIYVRPKIGFCNCSTGVSDEAELERVADTDLLSPKVKPVGGGQPVKIGWMKGLRRSYVTSDDEGDERVLSVGYNDECDVVVAVARLGGADPAVIEPAILAFLSSNPMVLWAKKELGLEYMRRDW
jgi:hypothetical protein